MRATLWIAMAGSLFLLFSACGGSSSDGDADADADGDTDGDGDADGDGGWEIDADGPITRQDGGVEIEEDGGTWTCYVVSCAGHVTECGDCEDHA